MMVVVTVDAEEARVVAGRYHARRGTTCRNPALARTKAKLTRFCAAALPKACAMSPR